MSIKISYFYWSIFSVELNFKYLKVNADPLGFFRKALIMKSKQIVRILSIKRKRS